MLVQIPRLGEARDGIRTSVDSAKTSENTDVHAIKQVVRVIFVALEDLDVLKHLLVYRNLVVVSDRVLAEEVEDDIIWRFKCDMLATQ